MSTHASGTFEIKGWEEKTYDEIDGKAKLTRASVKQTFAGDLEGEGNVEYLMAYRDDGSASFVGLLRVTGSVGGRSGSFVLQLSGSYEGQTAKADWVVVRGAGTEELRGLRGKGGFAATHGMKGSTTLDYYFE